MLPITYTEYPCILMTSYNENSAPFGFEIKYGHSDISNVNINGHDSLNLLINDIINMNEINQIPNTNYYYIGQPIIDLMSEHDFLQNNLMHYFASSKLKQSSGVFALPNGLQYVYMLVPLVGLEIEDGVQPVPYAFVCAFFKNETLLAIEKSIISGDTLDLFEPCKYYPDGYKKGDFTYLPMALLAYIEFNENLTLLNKNENKTSELIYNVPLIDVDLINPLYAKV